MSVREKQRKLISTTLGPHEHPTQ